LIEIDQCLLEKPDKLRLCPEPLQLIDLRG
jgi:hypothetical protein